MKTLLFLFTLLFLSMNLKAQNPWESIGRKDTMLTLSKGKYQEFIPNDTLVRIGSVWYNTVSEQVVGFAEQDTVLKQLGFDPSVNSRWLSKDPLAGEYPSLSPYNYVANNPINLTDPTGMCPEDGSAGDAGDGDGYCMEEIVVTATSLPEKENGSGLFSNTRRALPKLLVFTQLDSPFVPFFDLLAGAAATGFVAYDLYRTFNPAPVDQMMVSEAAATWEDIWEGAAPGEDTKGRTKQRVKDGGWEQANQDFDDLAPDEVVDIPGVGRTGVLPDGSRVTVKNKEHSSDDRPNLVRRKGKNRKKISYDE